MKVLLDTNIVLDYALERQPFLIQSNQIFLLIKQRKFEGYISASTFSDLYYIIRKDRGKDWALDFLNRLASFCQIATCDREVIEIALQANFKDFEDAIQYGAAVVNRLDGIVTRNERDFPVSDIQILTCDRLMETIAAL
ncbi:MAG: type II toxin-antitoxin system VapC family toxin [Spirulina sp.]